MMDYRNAAYYAACHTADMAELGQLEWDDIDPGMDDYGMAEPDDDIDDAWGMWREATYDPDYPLGR